MLQLHPALDQSDSTQTRLQTPLPSSHPLHLSAWRAVRFFIAVLTPCRASQTPYHACVSQCRPFRAYHPSPSEYPHPTSVSLPSPCRSLQQTHLILIELRVCILTEL